MQRLSILSVLTAATSSLPCHPNADGILLCAARFKSLICPECKPHAPDSSTSVRFLRIASNATRTLHLCEGLVVIMILYRRFQQIIHLNKWSEVLRLSLFERSPRRLFNISWCIFLENYPKVKEFQDYRPFCKLVLCHLTNPLLMSIFKGI